MSGIIDPNPIDRGDAYNLRYVGKITKDGKTYEKAVFAGEHDNPIGVSFDAGTMEQYGIEPDQKLRFYPKTREIFSEDSTKDKPLITKDFFEDPLSNEDKERLRRFVARGKPMRESPQDL